MRIPATTMVLAAATLAATALTGCGKPATPVPALPIATVPAPAPGPTAAGKAEPWLDDSPLRTSMRSMWVDCGIILSVAAPQGSQIDHDRVECAAEDIARKATRMVELWTTVRDAVDGCESSAKTGEWDAAWQLHGRIWKRCCDCHVETWTASRRGVSIAALAGWRVSDPEVSRTLPKGALGSPDNGPSDPPVKEQMRMLATATTAMRTALDGESAADVAKAAATSRALIDEDVRVWEVIAAKARAIQELAQGRASEDAATLYGEMTAQCTACHARYVTSPHDQLAPPTWK